MTTKFDPETRVSEYLLEECIGKGAFGEVWRARHHVWKDDRVAIKLPTEPEYVRYLQREGVVVHGLRHPNIVRVLGLDPYADLPYLVMELVKGPSLRDVLNENPTGIDIDTAIVILRGILHGMVAAHEAGVMHRDLKPGNVLLNLDGQPLSAISVANVKVSDFGLGVANADTLRSIAQSASFSREEELVGTLAYMAPEVRDGNTEPAAKADLYAIGVILFELLTGDRPAGAELPSSVRSNAPKELDEVFQRLYARKERRYETAQAALEDLDARLSPPVASPPPPPRPSQGAAGDALHATCAGCGQVLETGDQYCTACGKQVVEQVRRCATCQGYPGPHDSFCIFCGAALTLAGE